MVVNGRNGTWGTGFGVGKEGTIVTAAHVVCPRGEKAPETVGVRNFNGKQWLAKVRSCWPGGWLDVCVLEISSADCCSLPLSTSDAHAGDAVRLLSATQWNVSMETEGHVMSHTTGVQLVTNAVAWGGCSGGPLLSASSGEVVGFLVSTASISKTRIPRLSLFLPVSIWRRFVENPNESMDNENLKQQVEKVWMNDMPQLPPKFKEFISKL